MSAPDFFLDIIRRIFNDFRVSRLHQVEVLWSGYGEVVRYAIPSQNSTCIVKHIDLTASVNHPRGWHTDFAHRRKLSSYYNEQHFYQHLCKHCNEYCKVPELIASGTDKQKIWLIMEDLDVSGFFVRCEQTMEKSDAQAAGQDHEKDIPMPLKTCIEWLANFHSVFLSKDIGSVWPVGTYWFLDTRPDEFNSMPESALKNAAGAIDDKLNTTKYQTLLHGDAKVANFCFTKNKEAAAAVDFQYAGRGCGAKDLIYLLGSYYSNNLLYSHANKAIDHYFVSLKRSKSNTLNIEEKNALEMQWRGLIPFAWADFQRFLSGWSPSHKKLNQYSADQSKLALSYLNSNI